jgi:hypothetical protein
MTAPQIHPRFRTVPASLLLKTLGESLEAIKSEDEATDADLGAVLGKSDDTAARYRTGLAEMPIVAFLRGCGKWDGRFANAALALVGMKLSPLDAAEGCDRKSFTALCALLSEMAQALEDDNEIDDRELLSMRPEIEAASKHLDRLRERLRLRAVANT